MPLFDEFEPVSAKQWKQKIQFDLDGTDYNETLLFQTLEGIAIKPFYHQDDLKDYHYPISLPKSNSVTQKITVSDGKTGNKAALDAISRGAESLYFLISSDTVDIALLLKEIPETTTCYISCCFLSPVYLQKISVIVENTKQTVIVLLDCIGQLAITGNWYENQKNDMNAIASIIAHSSKQVQSHIAIGLDSYQNAGGNCIQQLAYGLAHVHEYIHYFNIQKENPLQHNVPIFEVAIGSHYLFEIAKLRALRWLWSTLAEAYELPENCIIMATPSIRNKTIIEAHANSIRSGMECMSAFLGGSDVVYNFPYDSLFKNTNEFSTRIALNQLLILKDECHLTDHDDPVNGCYAIETLTQQMATKALELFKTIEKGGGFLTQLKNENIQRKIKENASREQRLFDQGSLTLVGLNSYFDKDALAEIALEKQPFPERKPRKTLFAPIVKRRLAEKLERRLLIIRGANK